jgi:hypothetical protein
MLAIAMICLCALWGGPLLELARADQSQQDSEETQRQAAQVALLVLRATVQGAASTRRSFILPSRVPLSSDQAARALAVLKKPVGCAGSMEGAILAVACQPLNEAEGLWHDQGAAGHLNLFAADARERCPEPISEASLLLHWRGTSMTVPFHTLAAWLRDYEMEFSLGRDQTAILPRGVCMVLAFGPPATMKIQRRKTGSLRS